MGDSEASTEVVTSEVVREEGATIQSVTKHTVTSVESSHMESTQESVVHVESVVQQSASATHQEVSQTHSIATSSSSEETKAVEEAPPPPAIEPQPVDENANSIPDEPAPAAQPIPEPPPLPSAPASAPEPAAEPAPEPVPEPAAEPVPETAPEPAAKPVQEAAPEPVVESAPEPASEPASAAEEISQENIKTQLHEIISEIELEVLPEQDEVKEDAKVEVVAPVQEPQPVVELQPVEVPQPVAESQLVVEPQPFAEPQLVGGVVPPFIYEGEMEKVEYYDEDGTLRHTWRARGNYNVPKLELVYEDIVPIEVPDIKIKEVEMKPLPPAAPAPGDGLGQMVQNHVPNNVEGLTNGVLEGEDGFGLDIPEGIPLLARILPKTDQGLEGDKKISLERLFTPATDSGDLTPTQKKKAFSSSAFYRPDHPTIDDQVELAQRISFSLVDDNNKMSRGQSMYMKRKKRSMRWIHEGEEGLYEDYEAPEMDMLEDVNRGPPEKPNMKLLMSSKGVQDFHQVQEHYQNLLNQPAPPSPDVNKIVTDLASPTGKGAELFAKRKKRMDQFIVDETNVKRSSFTQQQSSSSSFSSSSSQNISTGVSVTAPAGQPGAGAMYTAEVKVIQRASLPPTPIDVPHHSLLDLVEDDKSDKRLSASFNLAAKGWGTYNKFYTPVTFSTKS